MIRCSCLGAALVIASTALLVGGCTSAATGTLNGEVTLDGAALKEGHARFVPVGGKGTTGRADITNGRYQATLGVGEYVVEFSAPKVIGKRKMMPDSPEVDDVIELIPDKYNVKSDLKVVIQSGSQEKSFELKSK